MVVVVVVVVAVVVSVVVVVVVVGAGLLARPHIAEPVRAGSLFNDPPQLVAILAQACACGRMQSHSWQF